MYDVDMGVDADMAVSMSWGSFKESYRAPSQGIDLYKDYIGCFYKLRSL